MKTAAQWAASRHFVIELEEAFANAMKEADEEGYTRGFAVAREAAAQIADERVTADSGATPAERKDRASDPRADEADYIARSIRALER